jgi:cytochrome c553
MGIASVAWRIFYVKGSRLLCSHSRGNNQGGEMKRKRQILVSLYLFLVAVFLWVFSCGQVVAADIYANSAHGNNSYGVNRSGTPDDELRYHKGSCAHCHDTFDETICGNPLMLFAPNNPDSQTHNFCLFQCHKSDGAAQQVTNYTYSKNFGGGDITFTTIYDAFNPTIGVTPSSHNLSDIQGYVAGHYGFSSETNACIACHNQHTAQQNYPVTFTGTGGVQTAIRRPVHNEILPGNLWGDEDYATSGLYELTNEVFEAQGLTYQAPYYEGGFNYEPANNTTSDGSNLPNIISFCLDCHSHENVPSTEHGRYLRKIDWANEEHGQLHTGGNAVGASIAPYTDNDFNYVLACTDCHEPHGSENEWLLRTTINGKDNISVPGDGEWFEVCGACHTFNHFHYGKVTTCWGDGVPNCHRHGALGSMF